MKTAPELPPQPDNKPPPLLSKISLQAVRMVGVLSWLLVTIVVSILCQQSIDVPPSVATASMEHLRERLETAETYADILVQSLDSFEETAELLNVQATYIGPLDGTRSVLATTDLSPIDIRVEEAPWTVTFDILNPSTFHVVPVDDESWVAVRMEWLQALRSFSDIDVVVDSVQSVFSFQAIDGEVVFRGDDKIHSEHFSEYKAEIQVGRHTITMYPTDGQTVRPPDIHVVIIVACMLFLLLFMAASEYWVRREFRTHRDLLDAKRAFVRYVSHEVRTPLNSVCVGLTLLQEQMANHLGFDSGTALKRSFTQNMIDGDNHSTQWFILVQEVMESAQVSVGVLNDMLNYDKVERGELKLELTVVKIWKLIQSCLDEFRIPALQKNVTLDFSFRTMEGIPRNRESELPRSMRRQGAIGDDMRLKQVIRNLVSNALKFTPAQGTITVTAALMPTVRETTEHEFTIKTGEDMTAETADALELQVKDNGVGMSPEQLAKLFRPGTQFNRNNLQAGQGSGLGLFISKGIVKQHHGNLEATSDGLGRGSTLTMMLPLYQSAYILQKESDSTDLEEGKRAPQFYSSAISTALPMNHKLLVVDDVVSSRKLMSRLLTHHGHTCDMAEDGQQALDMVTEAIEKGDPYHSILLDYEMPVLNGPLAAKEMRRRKLSPCFIVGVTGNMLPDDVTYFMDCGANVILPKPFQMPMIEEIWSKMEDYPNRSTSMKSVTS